MSAPTVELLYLDGCPKRQHALELIEATLAELNLPAVIEQTKVSSPEQAAALRFLGSPSVRVDGRDIEPGAETRERFVLSCRLYPTEHGLAGMPSKAWLRAALEQASR